VAESSPLASLPYTVTYGKVYLVGGSASSLMEGNRSMHSSQIIENVAHDLVEGGTYSALTIQHAIDSLNRALIALHNEEIEGAN
jgi:hypothetical protein